MSELKDMMHAMMQQNLTYQKASDEKISALTTHTKMLETQLAQMATSNSSRQQGHLPPKGTQPNETVNAIFLRSGTEYEGPRMPIEEGEEEEVEESGIEAGQPKADRLSCTTDRPSNNEPSRKPKADRLLTSTDRPSETSDRFCAETTKNSEIPNSEAKAKAKEPERPIEIKLPFPNRQRSAKVESQFTKFMEVVKNLQVSVPFTELITQVPAYARFLKEIITRKRSLNTCETVAFTEECSQILQGRSPPKLNDPGSFSITCAIGNLVIDKALCDLGASVSVMPYSVCKKLNMGDLKFTTMTLQMADRSMKYPRGILEDVPVKIGKFFIPVDFVVLDMAEDAQIPIILGRPFLHTAGAVIDVKNGNLTLEVAGEKITFKLSHTLKQPMIEESCNFIDVIDDVVEEVWYESLMRDPLEALMCLDSCADDLDTNSAVVDALEAALDPREQSKNVHTLMHPSVAVGAGLGTTETPTKEQKEGQTPSKKKEQSQPVAKQWVEVKRKSPGERRKVRGLPLVSDPTTLTIEKQVEDLRKELAEAMQVVVTAVSRLAVLEKKIKPPDIAEYEIGRFGGGTPLPGID